MSQLIKTLVAAFAALLSAAAFAAVDVNKGSQAELEAFKSIGPVLAGRILEERQKSPFKDWSDMIDRVKGIGPGNAAKFSAEGMTVNGSTFAGAAPAPGKVAKKDSARAAAKPVDGKSAEPKASK